MNAALDPTLYPDLFRPVFWEWGNIDAVFQRLDAPPPSELVANVNIVPYIGSEWVVIQLNNGQTEIPGGTLEAGETWEAAARRELLEEAGAELLSFTVLGAWKCYCHNPQPYRLHQPHPEYYRLVLLGEVRLIGAPSNPTGGEQVARVDCVPVDEALRRFRAVSRPDLADLYHFGAAVRW